MRVQMKLWQPLAFGTVLLISTLLHAHENGPAPQAHLLGPVKGKTVRVTQAEIDLLLQAQPDTLKLDEAAKLQTQAQVREVLLQRAMLERGALEAGLDKDPRIQRQMQAARQLVLANAYSQRLADPDQVADQDIDAEYKRAKSDLIETEYQMQRLAFVDENKANQVALALADRSMWFKLKKQLGLAPAEALGEWRWIASQRMPKPVLEEVVRLQQNPKETARPVRVEGTWYVVQVKDKRVAAYPEKADVAPQIRQKLAQERVQSWLIQRQKFEGLAHLNTHQPANH
jgi:peptidyl-prolyl cis-trans isomerase C